MSQGWQEIMVEKVSLENGYVHKYIDGAQDAR